MEQTLAAWLIAGGPRIDIPSQTRDREHLATLRAEARLRSFGPSWTTRLTAAVRAAASPEPTRVDPACCPA